MADERKWKNIALIVLVCLIVVLTLIDVGAFTIAKIQAQQIKNVRAELQQQQVGVASFVSQLQRCKTMKDIDELLKSVNVERIK